MRLDRFICKNTDRSHRDTRLDIARGRVRLDGVTVTDPTYPVGRFTRVDLGDLRLQDQSSHYLMLNKPAGYLSATRDPDHPTVMEFIPQSLRPLLHIGGRLDLATSGLLILTNDGLWSRLLTDPQAKKPKVYKVRTSRPIASDTAIRFSSGIQLVREGLTTSPANFERLGPFEARLTIYEGRYHQVKRMFAAVGNRVAALHRERMGEIRLDPALQPGECRELTSTEIASVIST